MSSLFFNTVLQMALRDDVECWQKSKGMGIRLGDHESDCFTSLRFADDVALVLHFTGAASKKMMCDFKQST